MARIKQYSCNVLFFSSRTKQDAERHISSCLGFEDIDDGDQDMEW